MYRLYFLIALSACSDSSDSASEFVFGVHVSMSGDITNVVVDGSPVMLEPFGSGSLLRLERRYPSYQGLEVSPVIMIEFLSGADLRYTGSVRAGWCEELCVYEFCPKPQETTSEILELNLRSDFTTSDFDCMECTGGGRYSKSCQ